MGEDALEQLDCLAGAVKRLRDQVKEGGQLPSLTLAQIVVNCDKMSGRLGKFSATLNKANGKAGKAKG